MMTEKLNLTLSELAAAKRNFSRKYQQVDPEPGFGRDICISRTEWLHHIRSAVTWPPDRTVLRFIHRYDKDGWFLTMECCHVGSGGTIDAFGPRFDLRRNAMKPSTGFTGNYDPAYFRNITYEGNSLVPGMHVNYVMLPWAQEYIVAAERKAVLRDSDSNIVISSISLDFGHNSSKVNVRWPHIFALFFSDAEGSLCDDVAYSSSNPLLKAKAHDCGGLCPGNYSHLYSWSSLFGEAQLC